MKKQYIPFVAGALAAAMLGCVSCEGEKDLIIIEGNLPIKTTTLYMVGDATPTGWSIDNPTPLAAEGEDPLVFEWEGSLNTGEIKLCLVPGSWDVGFIRPETNGTAISSTDITDATFAMHAGDPDDKWKVTEAGSYHLTFDLRNWTMSTRYLGSAPAPVIEPIETETVYMVGDATPNGWNIDAPTELTKVSAYIFEYEGVLLAGELKCCLAPGSWDVDFIRPASEGVEINRDGVADPGFVFTGSPDNKWKVSVGGTYKLTFDLEKWTIAAKFLAELPTQEKTPIEAENVYMIGDATPGGWSLDAASTFTKTSGYVWTWEGELVNGSFKAMTDNSSFDVPFIRPEKAGVEVNDKGVAESGFVFTTAPDDQWKVTKAGTYKLTLDLENWTIAAEYKGGGSEPEEPEQPEQPVDPGTKPFEAKTLNLIGDATPGGWSMDELTALTLDADGNFVWEGELKTGEMKACVEADGSFSCPFVRPTFNGCKISRTGVEDPAFVYTTDPDDKWQIADAGKYRLVFDTKKWTLTATFIQ